MKLWLDLETYNEIPISHGTYKYAEHSEIMLFGYAIDDEPAKVLDCINTPSGEYHNFIWKLLAQANEIWAHNVMFDKTVLNQNGFISHVKKWRCTMVQAYEHGLPGNLDKLGAVLGLPIDQQKFKDGHKLVHLFCKPRPKNQKLRRATRETHPEEWARFIEYCRQDVEAMRECYRKMPKLNYPNSKELQYWHLDQQINDRGMRIDLDLVHGAIETTKKEKKRLDSETQDQTDNNITSATQRDKLLTYIMEAMGYPLPDLKKDTLERRLEDDNVPEDVKELLRLRLQTASSSTSKYSKIRDAVNSDGRFRGGIQFCGAKRTGRDAGRTFQPQNLPSRGLLDQSQTDYGITLLRNGITPPRELFPDFMKLLVSAIRGVVVAAPDKKLVVADLANIEGRFAAWVVGESWKVKASKNYDKGTGPDLYNLAYAKSFNCPIESVTKDQRQIGKVQELMLQYGGGVGAFVTGAETYGFDIEELASTIFDTLSNDVLAESEDFYEWYTGQKKPTFGLSKKAFLTCDVLKRLWRRNNPKIAAFWGNLETQVQEAMDSTHAVNCGKHIKILKKGNYLYIQLPSGRCLIYPGPKYKNDQLTFLGDNPYTRKYERLSTYGGKLFENICQAGSRDVLFLGKEAAENAGYQNILAVHDELLTEVPDNEKFNVGGLCKLMTQGADWCKGLPLAASGFEGYRYKK